jgi:L-threonylcarbamoyladenylate synthase
VGEFVRDPADSGNGLRRSSRDGAVEHLSSEQHNIGVCVVEVLQPGTVEEGFASLPQEDGFKQDTGGVGFDDGVFAFNADKFAGLSCLAAQRRAQGLHAGVTAARDGIAEVHSSSVCVGLRRLLVVARAKRYEPRGGTNYGNDRHDLCSGGYDRVTVGGFASLIAEVLRIHPDEPEPFLIEQVAESLRRGDCVALPTDTFYGLAVDPVNLRAVEHIYFLKTRARHKPLSLLIADVAQAYEVARGIDSAFDRLAEKFWPGPLTIVVKAGSKLPLRVTANTGNVALRVPEAPICRAVVTELGLPITATSANLRGLPECTYAGCVREQFGEKIPLIVDGGPTARDVATTIVDLSGGGNSWMILREGAIPTHEIALALQH